MEDISHSSQTCLSLFLECVRSFLSHELSNLIANNILQDAAFIGNTSGFYNWTEASLIDLDLWLFTTDRLDKDLHARIMTLMNKCNNLCTDRGVDFSFGAYDGPYKPGILILYRPSLFVHILLDDHYSYQNRSILTRFCWRKYQGLRNKNILSTLGPSVVDINDFNNAKFGYNFLYDCILKRGITYDHINLQRNIVDLCSFRFPSPQFSECCIYSCLTTARNYCRINKYQEADSLGNKEFFAWFNENIFLSNNLSKILRYKSLARTYGYAFLDNSELYQRTINFFGEVKSYAEK